MKKPLPLSEETLNAFVDNELEGEECERVLTEEAANSAVAQEICELRRLKTLVRAARPEASAKISNISLRRKRRQKSWYAVASFALLTSLVTVLSVLTEEPPTVQYSAESTYPHADALLVAAQVEPDLKLVLHLNSGDRKSATHILHVLRTVLSTSEQHRGHLQVEVIVSGPGLRVLQKNHSAYTREVRSILKQYANVAFIACGKTLQQFKKNTPKDIQLMEEAMLVSSGPQWAKQRRQQGWSYILI